SVIRANAAGSGPRNNAEWSRLPWFARVVVREVAGLRTKPPPWHTRGTNVRDPCRDGLADPCGQPAANPYDEWPCVPSAVARDRASRPAGCASKLPFGGSNPSGPIAGTA